SFEGKKNRLPIIHVQSKNRKTIINNNFFGNVAPRKGEALEAVRIGLGDGPAECTLASNTFFKYHGDSETVSVKADKVRLVNNQFIYCRSGISLRGSDNSIVEENVFSYANTPLRISGKGHKIFDNIFKGNTGPDIVLMTGGPNYNPVSNNEIFNNYFYDQFNVGLLTYQNYDIMPDHISLHDNYVIGNSINSPLQDVTFLKSSFSKKSITEVRVSKDFTLKEMIFK
ncbi:MAG: chondroitinase-B domain-containing protein, partial [Nonlabens sp.]